MNYFERQLLSEVCLKILMDATFLFTDSPEKPLQPDSSTPLEKIQISFQGPFKGYLQLVMPRPLCLTLTANFLGYEIHDDFVIQNALDGAKELLNILSSHWLTVLGGPDAVFKLSVPESNPFSYSEWESLAGHENSILMTVEGHPLLIHAAHRCTPGK